MKVSVISHELLYRKDISLRAKAIYAFLQGKEDGWDLDKESISIDCAEDINKVDLAITELLTHGYLREEILNGKKHFALHSNVLIHERKCSFDNSEVQNKEMTNQNKNINILFSEFWEAYDKKTGRVKAEAKWKRLKDSDRSEIMKYIPYYLLKQPDKKYRKDPVTFLNSKIWQDEWDMSEFQSLSECDQKTFYQYKTTDDLLKDYPSQYTFIAYMFWRLWISEQETKTLIDATVEEWTNQVKNIIEVDKQRVERLIAVYQFFKQCKSQQAGYDTFWYSKTKTIASFRNTNQNGEYKLDLIANEVNDKIARDPDFGRLVQNKIKQFKEHESIKLS